MSGTLTSWRTAVLAILDDASSARYSSVQVDAAIRQALQRYNISRPLLKTYSVDGQDTYQIVMPSYFVTEHVTQVALDDDSDPPTLLTFYAFRQDEQWMIETRDYLVTGDQSILVSYTSGHTLDGLDSGAGTTIPLVDEYAIKLGAAAFALLSRSASRSESINLLPEVAAQLRELSALYMAQFEKLTGPHPSPTFTAEPELRSDVF